MKRLLYSYYGDDYTGSSDVLEALALNGVDAVLFLEPPTGQQLARFDHVQAIGLAGDSRSRSPEWMDANLPDIFSRLKSLGAPILHYKVCSTFDSSFHRGSIGRAMDIGTKIYDSTFLPIVVAAPHLRRYVVFGNLFAGAGADPEIFRIDRHPTMSRHPATPMKEADLRHHLVTQTAMPVGLVDLPTLRSGQAGERIETLQNGGANAILFDGLTASDLDEIGRQLWNRRGNSPMFAVGSSGLTNSMVAQWRNQGLINNTPQQTPTYGEVDRLVVMSGSCSPITARQIDWALANGFEALPITPSTFLGDNAAFQDCLTSALDILDKGKNIIIYSALGPLSASETVQGEDLGVAMGVLLRAVLACSNVKRVLLAGGDTSSHAVKQLGLYALTWAQALEVGVPLCRAHSDNEIDGLELVLKGGQVGNYDFFETVRRGKAS
jgi:uncharacterized protein YgbK (DUF1537 family)